MIQRSNLGDSELPSLSEWQSQWATAHYPTVYWSQGSTVAEWEGSTSLGTLPCLPTVVYLTQIMFSQKPARESSTLRDKMLDKETIPWNENKFTAVLYISFLSTLLSTYVHILKKQKVVMGKETAPVCLFHIFCIKLKNIQKSIEKKTLHPFIRENNASNFVFCPSGS